MNISDGGAGATGVEQKKRGGGDGVLRAGSSKLFGQKEAGCCRRMDKTGKGERWQNYPNDKAA